MGFVVPATLISDSDAVDPNGRYKVNQYIFVQNCIVTMGTLPLLIFAKAGPPTPPSASASRAQEPMNFKKDLGLLLKNRSYMATHRLTMPSSEVYSSSVVSLAPSY